MVRRRWVRWMLWCGVAAAGPLAVVLSAPFWLRPFIEHWASVTLARPVTMSHLHLALGAPLVISAEDVVIGNPQNFPSGQDPLASVSLLKVGIDAIASLRQRKAAIAWVELKRPIVHARQTQDGQENYRLPRFAAPRDALNTLKIVGGRARVSLASLHADFEATFAAGQTPAAANMTKITAEAKGTYTDQPIEAHFVGEMPAAADDSPQWPIELEVQNGPTQLALKGTVKDLLSFHDALLSIFVRGPDMALLKPLTGVPFPASPPYEFQGELDHAGKVYRLTKAAGRLGHSDVAGSLTVATRSGTRPEITAQLHSNSVALTDIESLLGGQPGSPGTPGQTSQQRAQATHKQAEAQANPRVLPQALLHPAKLDLADVHLVYRGDRIQGASMPVDDITIHMDVEGGAATLHPLSFGVGGGRISGDVWLTPRGDLLQTRAEMKFERLDVSHLMRATGNFQGRGELNGTARVEGTGRSVADILGHADGAASVSMAGGDLSKLLVDLVGLRLGSALLSSLGSPSNTQVDCFVADLALRRGLLSTNTLLLKTENTVTRGAGVIDLGREQVELQLRTASRHLTVGVLPAPLVISGSLKDLHAAPVTPGGLVGALAYVPTIQLGIGNGPRCGGPSSATAGSALGYRE